MKTYITLLLGATILFYACGSSGSSGKETAGKDSAATKEKADAAGGEKAADASDSFDARTPVTVTTVSNDPLNDYTELNAVSAFLQKSYVKANTNGYLQSADVYPGKYVETGQPLFTLRTKEAQTIGNSLKILDSSLHFSGLNTIRAGQHGYITQLNHQSGDYVQDGEQLAVISDRNSFVFLLNLPYELRPCVLGKKNVELFLPDGTKLEGVIGAAMPTVDSASQTQNVIIRVNSASAIPENLIARVRIIRSAKISSQSLPRAALLTDETESDFWVMKLIDSATAVKVPVKKGIETTDRVEVLSPRFSASDRILVTGNYGLPDTAKVKVEVPQP
ncbi:MAG TPA: HlyD family efflux transporter periplasmic adaptor subunit [Puia sp.]|jgi:multidrug efflux pump subunit AcrA (membrane-fusion protein)